jgi:hypothetical protein
LLQDTTSTVDINRQRRYLTAEFLKHDLVLLGSVAVKFQEFIESGKITVLRFLPRLSFLRKMLRNPFPQLSISSLSRILACLCSTKEKVTSYIHDYLSKVVKTSAISRILDLVDTHFIGILKKARNKQSYNNKNMVDAIAYSYIGNEEDEDYYRLCTE